MYTCKWVVCLLSVCFGIVKNWIVCCLEFSPNALWDTLLSLLDLENRRSFYRKKFRDNSEAKQQRTLFIRQGEVLIWQSK